MKKFLRINVYVMMALVLLASFAVPQVKAHGVKKSHQIHLHIQGEDLDKDAKVILVYKVKEKDKDKDKKKDKDKYTEKQLNMSRQNGELYKANKPSGFEATKDVKFKVKEDGKTTDYKPLKVTGSKGTINYWIKVRESDDNDDDDKDEDNNDVPVLKTFTHHEPIIPFVKDVYNNGNGTFTVYWGYQNNNDVVADAIDSRLSTAYVFNNSVPLKKGFAEGKVDEAFKTVFAGNSIVWELTGPDGVKRIATAYASNAKPYKSIQPLLKGVYKNNNGTFTAYWGYNNENNVAMDSKSSQFLTPALNNSQPMKTNFLPGIFNEAYKTTFNSLTLSWNLVGLNNANYTVTADSRMAKNYEGLLPTVKSVYDNGNGTFTAYFGYQNNNDVTVDAISSKFISGSVVSTSKPLAKNFLKGANPEAFSAVFKGNHLVWELTGPDGQKRYVVAYSTNAPKYTALHPIVNKVINNGNGTFTAVWGYHNLNSVVVHAKVSTFNGIVLKNEVAKKDDFNIGLHSNVYETTFMGAELTWNVKGPDGVTRSVTAYSKNAVTR